MQLFKLQEKLLDSCETIQRAYRNGRQWKSMRRLLLLCFTLLYVSTTSILIAPAQGVPAFDTCWNVMNTLVNYQQIAEDPLMSEYLQKHRQQNVEDTMQRVFSDHKELKPLVEKIIENPHGKSVIAEVKHTCGPAQYAAHVKNFIALYHRQKSSFTPDFEGRP